MASGKTHKNHYVSQFILRGFSSNKEKDKIWRCDLETGDIREDAIASVGYIKKGWSQEIEKFMNEEYESDTKSVIDKIVSRFDNYIQTEKIKLEDKVSKSDYHEILKFLYMQIIRSYISSSETDKNMNYHGISYREGRSLIMKKDFLNEMTHDKIFNELLKRQLFVFGMANEKRIFLTSDFPFILPSGNFNLTDKKTQWWFPINERMLIVVGGARTTTKNYIVYKLIKFQLNEIKEINLGLTEHASRFIFSSSEKMLRKYYPLWRIYNHKTIFDGLPKYLDS